jgi:hypothetical protein
MPDKPLPPTRTAWVPVLSRTGNVWLTPVSLPLIPQIANEPRYRTPPGLQPIKNSNGGPPRMFTGEAAGGHPFVGPSHAVRYADDARKGSDIVAWGETP